ncbi:hypothetical protein [Streptomyces sp. NPDC002676]
MPSTTVRTPVPPSQPTAVTAASTATAASPLRMPAPVARLILVAVVGPSTRERAGTFEAQQGTMIAGTFPLAEAAKSHELGDTGRTTGKPVLMSD